MGYWSKRSVHSSWLVAAGCLAFVIGVMSALIFGSPHLSVVVAACVCLAVGFWWRAKLALIPVVVGCAVIGLWYGAVHRGELAVYRQFYGQVLTLTGTIKEDPSRNDAGALVVQLSSIRLGGYEEPGAVWASLASKPDIKRGDRLTIEGTFEEGFGTFSGLMYRAKVVSVVRKEWGDPGRVVRDWFADAVRVSIAEPQASLGTGFLTGQKSALPSELADALQTAGLSHIVVASGYNLTILVRLARRLFMPVSKFAATAATSTMIMSFMAVTGLSPSMTRAGLVSGLSLAAWYYGRRFHPFVLLPFAAALTVAWQPSFAWGDLGWQLSFTAFAAVMIVSPLLQSFFFGDSPPGTLRQILGETIAAHLVTIPLIVLSFGLISHVAVVANLLIVPLVPLAMLLTFIAGIIGLVLPAVAALLCLPATWLLTYMTETATILADLPWAQSELVAEWWGAVVYYVLLAGGCWYMWWQTKLDLRQASLVE